MAAVAADAKKLKMSDPAFDEKCINTVRVLAADMVQKANSGHPGAPMGCAPMAHLLWSEVMNYDPAAPRWGDRDRFVLSNGHACALQYSMLHLTGYPLTLADLQAFRQLGSKTPGHPENHLTAGVEVSTGPLGQGLSNAVGLAIAERHLAAKFNTPEFPVVDHYTYVICGDGCLQEGVTAEASSLAGHLGLGKLIVLYDDNKISIDGETELSFTEDVLQRYAAYGWHTQAVAHGDSGDLAELRAAVAAARAVTDKPSLIKVRTTIGLGSAHEGTEKVHGSPLGAADLAAVKTKFGFDPAASFAVGADVAAHYTAAAARAAGKHASWRELFARYAAAHPAEAAEYTRTVERGELPANWAATLPAWTATDKALATRQSSQSVLSALVDAIPELVGGSADLTPSNLTKVRGNALDFQHATPAGRYLRFGVREHAMAAVCNGIAAHGGLVPFCSTFFNFAGYMLGAMRVSALSHLRVLYILTHDSVGVGEDGPTHQPVETLASLRAMPNFLMFRPADGNEVAGAYAVALQHAHTPAALALSRQACANLAGSSAAAVERGGYVLSDVAAPRVVLAATGSEVQLCVTAAAQLAAQGIPARVVSLPCLSLFDAQPAAYRASVLPDGVPTLSVEAGAVFGWEKYAHAHVGMTTFGTSAPSEKALAHFGFTADNVAAKAAALVAAYPAGAPSLARPQL